MTPIRSLACWVLGAALLAVPAASHAQDVAGATGFWDVSITSSVGVSPARLALSDDGSRLIGIVVGDRGPARVEGTRTAAEVTLRYSIDHEGTPLLIVMKAPASGDTLEGRVDFGGLAEGTWTAAKAAPPGVSGAWVLTADESGTPVQGQLVLVEDQGRVSGRLLARSHGIDGLVKGTIADGVLQLTVDATADGSPIVIELPGRITGDTLAGTYAVGDASGRWTAARP